MDDWLNDHPKPPTQRTSYRSLLYHLKPTEQHPQIFFFFFCRFKKIKSAASWFFVYIYRFLPVYIQVYLSRSMAPTAAMLILCHHGKSNSPPSLSSPTLSPATSFGLINPISAPKWFSLEKVICKARSDDKQKHARAVYHSSASENGFEEALRLSCW